MLAKQPVGCLKTGTGFREYGESAEETADNSYYGTVGENLQV
jgi:hypothetical protein